MPLPQRCSCLPLLGSQAADVALCCCPAVLEGAKAGRVPSEGLTNAFGMFLQNELGFAGNASLDSSWEEERRAQAACELFAVPA